MNNPNESNPPADHEPRTGGVSAETGLFAAGDRVRYVVSEGVVTGITRGGKCMVQWDRGPWAGKQKGFFDHAELHAANARSAGAIGEPGRQCPPGDRYVWVTAGR